jgi:hypothetical protein
MKFNVVEREISIFGSADYMVCVSGVDDHGEFNGTSDPLMHDGGYSATLEIERSDGDPLHVHCFYNGQWSFAFSPVEDGDELPPHHRTWGSVNDHSETLTIELPKGSSIKTVDRILST